MREIKFRGIHLNTNEWAYGFLFKGEGCLNGIKTEGYYIGLNFDEYEEVTPETTGQYTGLKDKNGKEIYEGDIVKVPATLNDNINILYVVFKKGSFLYWSPNQDNGVFVSKIDNNTIEIIGNIQDNPELLK